MKKKGFLWKRFNFCSEEIKHVGSSKKEEEEEELEDRGSYKEGERM